MFASVAAPPLVVLGLDTGTAHCGVALVQEPETVLFAAVVCPPGQLSVVRRITWVYTALRCLVQGTRMPCEATETARALPQAIALEIYTPPTRAVRATSARQWAEQNWMIGACLPLSQHGLQPTLHLYEARDWQRQVVGGRAGQPIGGKEGIRRVVELRTGYRFTTRATRTAGGHDSDAVGIALVCLDDLTWQRVTQQAGNVKT